jgi:hypothetical protein
MSERFYSKYFTPILIIVVLCIMVGGIVVLQFFDRLFMGTTYLNTVRMFCLAIIVNVIILTFIVMSFSKVKFEQGPVGPRGNKGPRGFNGMDGGFNVCGDHILSVQESRNEYRKLAPDMQKPNIITD